MSLSELKLNDIIASVQDTNQIYQKAFELVIKHCSNDPAHQPDHNQRVLTLIEYLAEKEGVTNQLDWQSLKLAGILHDLGSSSRMRKLQRSSDKLKSEDHSKQAFRIVSRFLEKEGFPQNQLQKIEEIIASHGSHGLNDSLEGQLLHDADLLEGLGAVGTLRITAFGGSIGRGFLGSLEFIKGKINRRQFRTKTGQRVGRKRIKKIQRWLKDIENELHNQDF